MRVATTRTEDSILRDFRDLPLLYRQKKLNSKLVRNDLLGKLPLKIRKVFVNNFLSEDGNNRDIRGTLILKHFFSSPDVSIPSSYIINHKMSSHKALEAIYNKSPKSLLDGYFYKSPAGDAIPDRLNEVVRVVPSLIRQARKGEKVKVLVPGSGSGYDIIRIISNNPDLKRTVEAYCIDNELSAIETGRKLARRAGLKNIKYIKGDLMKLNFSDVDLILLVGILCPLPNAVSVRVLKRMKSYCRKGGTIIASVTMQKMLIDDPVTCFVMDFIGWKLHYKTEEDVSEITSKAKLDWVHSFYDPKRMFHLMAICMV